MVTFGTDVMSMLPYESLDPKVSVDGGLNNQGQPTTKLRQYGYSISSKDYVKQQNEHQKQQSLSSSSKPEQIRKSFETDSTLFTLKGNTNSEKQQSQQQFAKDFTISKDVEKMLKNKMNGKSSLGLEGGEKFKRSSSSSSSSSSSNSSNSSSKHQQKFKQFFNKLNGKKT